MARMRTLPKAVDECREKDPGSCINIHALRRWVHEGLVPSVKTGKTFFVDMDKLEAFLSEGVAHADN